MRAFKLLVGVSMLTIACGETAVTKPPVSEPVEATPRSSSPMQGEGALRPATAASSEAPNTTRDSAATASATTTEVTPRPPTAPTVSTTNTTAPPAKVVKIDIIDVEAPPEAATVRVGDTVEVTLPLYPGTDWKVVGDQPTGTEFLQGYLGPNTHAMKYTWRIAGTKGKRTIKFLGTDANLPKEAPQVVSLVVTVE